MKLPAALGRTPQKCQAGLATASLGTAYGRRGQGLEKIIYLIYIFTFCTLIDPFTTREQRKACVPARGRRHTFTLAADSVSETWKPLEATSANVWLLCWSLATMNSWNGQIKALHCAVTSVASRIAQSSS